MVGISYGLFPEQIKYKIAMKNLSGFLMPLLLIGCLGTSFPLMAQEEAFSFQVEENEMDWFVDHILCEFDISISENTITDFLSSLLEDTTDPCDMIEPQDFGSTATTQTYKWFASAQAVDYTLASIGLSDGVMAHHQTTNNFYTFDSLTAQQYLFVFLANCLDGSSIANILIVDKDVYFQEEGYEEFAICGCRRQPLPLSPNSSCPFYNTVTFPWLNNTDINKYRYNIAGTIGETIYEAEFWVLHNVATPIEEVNILSCSDYFIDGEVNAIGDEENFQVIFSTIGVHIYLLNENLSFNEVSGVRCDGFTFDDGGLEYRKVMALEAGAENRLEVFPNPFFDQLSVKILPQYEGAVSLSLLAIDGTVVKNIKGEMDESQDLLALEVATIPPGIYTLVYEVAGNRFVEKVLKQ